MKGVINVCLEHKKKKERKHSAEDVFEVVIAKNFPKLMTDALVLNVC